jgi:phosphate butyryltransferase
MDLRRLDDLVTLTGENKPKRLVVAAAEDKHILDAINTAAKKKLVYPVLTGDKDIIRRYCIDIGYNLKDTELHHAPDQEQTCTLAVRLVKEGKAEILMKGMVSTASLLKAVLEKDNGLRKRDVLSHFALIEVPGYNKLIGITDAAINIQPDLKEKVSIIQNSVEVLHRLGFIKPRVAVLAPVEIVNPKMAATVDAAALHLMYLRNQIHGCIIDGPLALDNAVSAEAAKQKGIDSLVAGNADILVVPDLNSGNILYKSLVFLAGGTAAAVVMGARVPVVLTSRADSERSKFMSIALAAAMDNEIPT